MSVSYHHPKPPPPMPPPPPSRNDTSPLEFIDRKILHASYNQHHKPLSPQSTIHINHISTTTFNDSISLSPNQNSAAILRGNHIPHMTSTARTTLKSPSTALPASIDSNNPRQPQQHSNFSNLLSPYDPHSNSANLQRIHQLRRRRIVSVDQSASSGSYQLVNPDHQRITSRVELIPLPNSISLPRQPNSFHHLKRISGGGSQTPRVLLPIDEGEQLSIQMLVFEELHRNSSVEQENHLHKNMVAKKHLPKQKATAQASGNSTKNNSRSQSAVDQSFSTSQFPKQPRVQSYQQHNHTTHKQQDSAFDLHLNNHNPNVSVVKSQNHRSREHRRITDEQVYSSNSSITPYAPVTERLPGKKVPSPPPPPIPPEIINEDDKLQKLLKQPHSLDLSRRPSTNCAETVDGILKQHGINAKRGKLLDFDSYQKKQYQQQQQRQVQGSISEIISSAKREDIGEKQLVEAIEKPLVTQSAQKSKKNSFQTPFLQYISNQSIRQKHNRMLQQRPHLPTASVAVQMKASQRAIQQQRCSTDRSNQQNTSSQMQSMNAQTQSHFTGYQRYAERINSQFRRSHSSRAEEYQLQADEIIGRNRLSESMQLVPQTYGIKLEMLSRKSTRESIQGRASALPIERRSTAMQKINEETVEGGEVTISQQQVQQDFQRYQEQEDHEISSARKQHRK